MRLTDGGINSSCSKLDQSDLKELVKIPCGHRCHTMLGSRSGQVTEGYFLLRGHATHDLGIIFHAGSYVHGYIFPKLTFLIIIVHLKHTRSFMSYVT